MKLLGVYTLRDTYAPASRGHFWGQERLTGPLGTVEHHEGILQPLYLVVRQGPLESLGAETLDDIGGLLLHHQVLHEIIYLSDLVSDRALTGDGC